MQNGCEGKFLYFWYLIFSRNWIQESKCCKLSNFWYCTIQFLEFKKLNSIIWTCHASFNEILYLRMIVIDSLHYCLLLHLFWKRFRAESNVTNFGPFLVPSTIMNQVIIQKIVSLIVVTSFSALKNSLPQQKLCITKIMGLMRHESVNFGMGQNFFLLCNSANIYLFKFNNRNTRKRYRFPLLLILNIFHTFSWCFYCWL